MRRTERWIVVGVLALTGCGAAGGGGDGAKEGALTSVAPPAGEASAVSEADWPFPTGVFRADAPDAGLLELHVEPGRIRQYSITDGTPEIGYAATCVPADDVTMTCTERDGFRIVFRWGGTSDALDFTLVDSTPDAQRVWEGTPWVRVP